MRKYLKITREDFASLWKFLKGLRNSFSSIVFASLRKFRKGLQNSFSVSQGLRNSFFTALLSVLQLVPLGHFASLRKSCKRLWNCWMLNSFSDSLPCILNWFGKGFEALQNLDSSCNLASTYFAMTTQSSPSFLACFNDKKTIKTTKTCQKLINNTCKGP